MRKSIFLAATVAAILGALPWPSAQAGGIRPGHYAYLQLKNGDGWRLYDAGCLRWNFQTQAWYTRCGLPQNAPLGVAPIVVKD